MNEEELNDIIEIFTSILLTVMLLFIPFIIVNAMKIRKEEEIPSPPEEVWYEITIDNTSNSNDLTDYQVLLEINNDEQFFNDFNNDRKTIEAYDEDKSTSISFYIEEWDIINHNAKIWLKIPFIPANSIKKVYLKANLNRTISLSNPNETFDFYDDFEEGNLNKWILDEGNGEISLTSPGIEGNYAIELNQPRNDYDQVFVYENNIRNNIAIRVKMKPIEAVDSGIFGILARSGVERVGSSPSTRPKNSYFFFLSKRDQKAVIRFINDTGEETDITSTPYTVNFYVVYEMEARLFNNTLRLLINGEEILNATYEALSSGYNGLNVAECKAHGDNFIIRKYTEPEPTVTYIRC